MKDTTYTEENPKAAPSRPKGRMSRTDKNTLAVSAPALVYKNNFVLLIDEIAENVKASSLLQYRYV